MQFPKGQVRAVSVFVDGVRQGDFGRKRLGEAQAAIKKNDVPGLLAIVWFIRSKPPQSYFGGKWTPYDGPLKPPSLPKGKPCGSGGEAVYIPARIKPIVVALKKASDLEIDLIRKMLSL